MTDALAQLATTGETAESESAGSENAVDRLRRVSTLLDDAVRIPGTDFRIGLDPLVGLVPYVGDGTTAVLSAYIVAEAVRLGASRATVARMLLNVVVDATLGAVPVVGDVFDAVWKANARNVALLEARAADPESVTRDRWVVGTVLVTVLALSLVLLAGTAYLVVAVLGALNLL